MKRDYNIFFTSNRNKPDIYQIDYYEDNSFNGSRIHGNRKESSEDFYIFSTNPKNQDIYLFDLENCKNAYAIIKKLMNFLEERNL